MCLQMGWDKVWLEGDALMVGNALRQEYKRGGRFGHVIQEAVENLKTLQEWRVEHIPLEANGVAHNLAKFASSFT